MGTAWGIVRFLEGWERPNSGFVRRCFVCLESGMSGEPWNWRLTR